MMRENVYGHGKRLTWLRSHLHREQAIVEIGCGTGHMITRPLLEGGYQVTGVDLDAASIAFGRHLFTDAGLDPSRLVCGSFLELPGNPEVVILSEVLEHLPTAAIRDLLGAIRQRLRPGGLLLVTVPNGYGWFELEHLLWHRTGLGRWLERVGIPAGVASAKRRLLGRAAFDFTPSSLNPDGHLQRFTARSVRRALKIQGFRVEEFTGSALVSGPLSDLVVGGIAPLLRANAALGGWVPRLASGFYLAARVAER